MPRRATIVGGGDSGTGNKDRSEAASTEIVSRPNVGRAPPSPTAPSLQPALKSPEATLEKSVKADLGEVGEAWQRYQGTHDRDAVYGYLTVVYNLVMKWKREQRAWKSAGFALKLQGDTTSMRVEPFAVVIWCTSAPDKVDAKTRSKWSRALRVAEAFKGRDTSVREFIKGQGGINKCAARVREIPRNCPYCSSQIGPTTPTD
jgi:hypothetical protein